MKVLVIGGTGPTGPHVLNGLLERGHEVTILHRGVHEPDGLPEVEHIHADPHFEETLTEAIQGREFEVVLGLYGRLKVIAKVFQGRCRQLLGVTGISAYENLIEPDRFRPFGMKVAAREDGPVAGAHGEPPFFSGKIVEAERALMDRAEAGAYQGVIIRYPKIYGPRNPVPYEWSVIKRVQDGRKQMFVVDGGQEVVTRCASENAAHLILLAVDQPEAARNQIYNCRDMDQFTTRQWIEIVTDILGAQLETVSLPREIGQAAWAEIHPMPGTGSHSLVDNAKARIQLGYADVIPAKQAIANYVDWLVAHPLKPGDYPSFIDPFDYQAEDRLYAAYRTAMDSIPKDALRIPPQREHAHSMPHPKKPALQADHGGR